jgi:hypothetical protein
MFGFPRLQALVAKHGEVRALGDLLMEALYTFVGEGWEQEDDITLLTLKRSASLSLRFNYEGFCDELYVHRKTHRIRPLHPLRQPF